MTDITDLKKGSHIHLMGICGVAMASLAGLLKDMGFQVTGSDQNVYPPMSDLLKRLEIPVLEGYKKENLEPKPDFVIVGNVITKNHEEAQELMRLGIPYTSLPDAMGKLVIANRKSIVVSGTHGKTTTTSIMAWILKELKKGPGFLIGGIAKNFGTSFHLGEGNHFVIEGDEYDTAFFDKVPKFLYYKPYYVLLGSIEFDHIDIYNDISEVMKAFEGLAEKASPEGIWIYHKENENTQKISEKAKSKIKKSYGIERGDYQARNIVFSEEGSFFDLYYNKEKLINIHSHLFGDYNILNLLSCLALCHQMNLDLEKVKDAILNFQGVKRRQEILSTKNGITVIEDFAHHPTAVQMTIEAVKKRFKKRKVIAAFEPRSATSRTNVFQKEYTKAFLDADIIFIRKPFNQDKISEEKRFSSKVLVDELNKKGKQAFLFEDVKDAAKKIADLTSKGDAILLMSNGSFDGIYQEVLDLI